MRNFVWATVAATMIATSAFAASDVGAPLPSGKPAGVTRAQVPGSTALYVAAGVIIIAGIALVASSNGNSTVVTGTPTTTG
jgi:hypothetical protein